MKSKALDTIALVCAVLFVASALRLMSYFAQARLDASMENMLIRKREFCFLLMVGAFAVGAPCWFIIIRKRLKSGRS